MNIKLLYFGRPRENLKLAQEEVTLPQSAATMTDLLNLLRARSDDWAHELADNRVRCAVNQQMCDLAAPIKEGDEVAIFSPISGG